MNTTYTPSRWVNLSILQKAIRRGQTQLALRAARQLHQTEPATLLRRLRVIAIEDIAVGDLPLVHRVLTATHDESLALVPAMCAAIKDRSACDLCEAINAGQGGDTHLAMQAARLIREKVVLSSSVPLAEKVATLGYKLTREPLCFSIPLIANMAAANNSWQADSMTEAPLIDWVPAYVFDMYTREGKTAYRRVLKNHPTLRQQLETFTSSEQVLDLLGHAMFVLESEKLDRRLTYPGSDDIHRLGNLADITRWGVPYEQADTVLQLVQHAMSAIHGVRHEVLLVR